MADDTFEYITTDFMVSIDSGTPSVQPVEYIIELGEQGVPGVQGEQGEPGYSPVVNYTWDNNTIQFTLVNRDYTETTPNLYDYVLKRDGSNANDLLTLNKIQLVNNSPATQRIRTTGSTSLNIEGQGLLLRGDISASQAYPNRINIAPLGETITLGNTNRANIIINNNMATYNGNEIATVNNIGNGTITLTQGGVTKGTFTTNQSGNTTIELDAGGGKIPNPLNIGYVDQGIARTLNLGIDTSNNKIVSSYMEITGGSFYRAPLYFLENIALPLVGTVNSLGAIDLSINTMVGTDGTTDGVTGTVPAPLTTDAGKYLRADGTWATPSGGGGTSDYTELTNKPQINSVTLTGNKTSSDLGLQNELTQGTGISIANDTISIDNTVALKTDIPSLAGYATENWVTNQGYLTSISSSDVITALGYTPYSTSNPNGYTNNIGTVTSVNNTQPDANGNVSINIPDVSNYVTTNTTQTITGSKTFTQQLRVNSSNGILNYGGYQGLVRRNPNVSSVYTEPLLIVDNSDKNVTVGTQYTTLNLKGSSTRPTYNSNELALLSDIGSGGGAVDSVNGQTGDVVLTASDVGALPDSTTIPTKTSDLTNDSGFITSYTDTKNTAGTTNKTGTKMFLAAATSQGANPQTFSNSGCYIGTDNCLYSNSTKVLTAHQSLAGYVPTSRTINSKALSANITLTASDVGALPDSTIIPTNADYVDLTTTQTVGGVKTFTQNIQQNSGYHIYSDGIYEPISPNRNVISHSGSDLYVGSSDRSLKLQGSNNRPNYNTNELALLSDIPTVPTTDQTYNSTSTNPQSGKAVAGAISTKANTSTVNNHINNTKNPHKVTASQVGLGNVNNTSDLNKPISTATQTALDSKANTDLSNCTKPYIVESYVNGYSWYRVYSDGWCEQGGTYAGISGNSSKVMFLKPMQAKNVFASPRTGGNSYSVSNYYSLVNYTSYTDGFLIASNGSDGCWFASGYLI